MDDLRESKDEARCWHFNGEIDSDDVISTLTSVPGRPVLHLDQYKLIPVLTVAEQVLTSSELRNTGSAGGEGRFSSGLKVQCFVV